MFRVVGSITLLKESCDEFGKSYIARGAVHSKILMLILASKDILQVVKEMGPKKTKRKGIPVETEVSESENND